MKGLLKTFEAIMAILAILIIFVIFFLSSQSLPEFETVNMRVRGFQALKLLDDNGELRKFVITNDTVTIKNKLSQILSPSTNFDVNICQLNCTSLGIQADKLTTVSYLIAGDYNNFALRQIILYMW